MTWEQFFNWLMVWGGRVVHNDHRDPGGQTCWGISRRYHPGWPGWQLVDAGTTSVPDLERAVSAGLNGKLAVPPGLVDADGFVDDVLIPALKPVMHAALFRDERRKPARGNRVRDDGRAGMFLQQYGGDQRDQAIAV